MSTPLQSYLAKQKNGIPAGIYSVCSAHPLVLRAATELAEAAGSLLLVEATSNQVNQMGGYTGMQPADFRIFVEKIAVDAGFPHERLILGGDHLGPNPWRQLPSDRAKHAEEMVSAYARAGFNKIHLDCSMSCKGDPPTLSDAEVATRSAQLCLAAEAAYQQVGENPVYVIGTEVPTPGGATHVLDGLAVTSAEAAAHTLAVHREAFIAHGLTDAWTRVIALVVQPGVEFDHDSVVHYDRSKARRLVQWRRQDASDMVFEAHSTDYQNAHAYRELVEDGFAILKVGPALTFALREALYSLAEIEAQLIAPAEQSRLAETIEQVILAHPEAWQPYYAGDAKKQALLRRYSYSDRVRYYWHQPQIAAAVDRLILNLSVTAIPESMLSLYLPAQYARVRNGEISGDPTSLIVDKVKDVLRVYDRACNQNHGTWQRP
jgi:D-tagatose-1,6-bisphosphate aldolase subunit GatZ/KbaZ